MTLKITKKPATVSAEVTKQVTDNKTKQDISNETKMEDVAAPASAATPSAEPMCTVGFEAGYTHNLGNYTSARVHVLLHIPCPHSDIDAVFNYTKEWVQARLQVEIDDLTAE